MNFSENLIRIRKEKNMTQADLASKVGVSSAAICQFERGSKSPSIQTGKMIADVLGVRVEELLN